ncbi:MAG: nucleoside permease [Phycisphaerales bacterium JB040]
MSEGAKKSGSVVFVLLSVMMFLEFFLWGAWYVTMGPWMDAEGLGGSIATAYSLAPIAAIVSPFFLGLVADRFFASERVLAVLQLVGGAALILAPWAGEQSANAFLGMVLLHVLCFMPTLGLTNTIAFHNITDSEKQFPLIRVFGTVGWIVAGITLSQLAWDTSEQMFYLAGGSAIALGLFSFALPHTPAPAKGQPFSARDALGLDALSLLKDRSFFVFSLCSFLICIPLAAYYAYAGTYVGQSGFENIGTTMSFGQMSEIFFMLVMPLFFRRLGVKWMLLGGMGAWVLRYALFSLAVPDEVRWMILGGILLHGICYDFFFVTGQIYVDKAAGPKIRGAAQGFLVLITQGLGMFIGAQVMGLLYNRFTSLRVLDAGGDLVADLPPVPDGAELVVVDGMPRLIDASGEPLSVPGLEQGDLVGRTIMEVTDWESLWMYPSAFAGVIMVLFFLLFKSRPGRAVPAESPDHEAPVEPTAMVPEPEREA